MPNFLSENQIEQALLQRLRHLHGFDVLVCHAAEVEDLNDGSGRGDKREVILLDGVKQPRIRLVSKRRSIAIGALNPVGIRL